MTCQELLEQLNRLSKTQLKKELCVYSKMYCIVISIKGISTPKNELMEGVDQECQNDMILVI